MKTIQFGAGQDMGFAGKSIRRYLVTTALTASGLMAMASPALADNWTDHVAGEGSISIDTSVPSTTNIKQNTNFVKVHGDGDINAGWTVNVAQPSSSSKYVLYDIESDPTEIMGSLNANGQIYIFDQNGVIFGQDSQVNVGSITASTGTISDANIKADKYVFENVGTIGEVVNKGSISVGDAGLAAFVAPTVKNSGIINAKMGKVVLASGEKVTLDLYGDDLVNIAVDSKSNGALVENSGEIIAEGGNVALTVSAAKNAVDNIINMDGMIDVSSVSVKGGKIVLSGGNKGVVNVSGKIKADGKDGGTVKVTGQNILASDNSSITASAVTAGNGGKVDIVANEGLVYSGKIEAKGGALSGNGGKVDTSGKSWVDVDGTVDASATNGSNGSWLIDPSNLRIVSGTSSNSTGDGSSGNPFEPMGGFFSGVSRIRNTVVNSALDSGTDVYITTVGSSDKLLQDGTISIEADLTKTAAGGSTLFMDAAGGILSDASATISATGGALLNVVMKAASNIVLGGDILTQGGVVTLTSTNGNVVIANGGLINTAGGNITARALGTVTTLLGVPVTGNIATYGVLNANGGNIDLRQSALFDGDVDSLRTSGTGKIFMNQNKINAFGSIQDAVDAVENTGTGTNTISVGAGTYLESVQIYENNFVMKGANAGKTGYDPTRGAESIIDPNSPGFNVTGDNAVIDGFEITGATGLDGHGVRVFEASNATVINNYIHDVSQNGVHYSSATGGGYIAGNKIDDTGHNGVLLRNSLGEYIVEVNEIGLDPSEGSILGNGVYAQNIYGGAIRKNKISNTVQDEPAGNDASGVYLLGTGGVVVGGSDVSDANIITNVDWDGVKVEDGTGNLVQNNNISGTTRVGVWGIATNALRVLDNIITDTNVTAGIGILGGTGVEIDGNKITDTYGDGGTRGDGISVKETGGVITITDNIVGEAGEEPSTFIVGNGIALYDVNSASSVKIQRNEIHNTKTEISDRASGIYAINSKNVLIGGPETDGSGDFINGNLIRGADWDGVKVDSGSGNVVQGNDIAGSTRVGIWGIATRQLQVLSNLVVDSNVTAGIGILGGTDVLIQDNEVYDTFGTGGERGDGISVRDTDGFIAIADNIVGEAGTKIVGNGIALYKINNAVVQRNTITNTKTEIDDRASGIYVLNGENNLIGGPETDEDGNYINGNIISGADWDGIKIDSGYDNIVQGNDVSDSTRVGIWSISTHHISVLNNTIDNSNVTAGIGVLTSYHAIIDGNTVNDSVNDGISVVGSEGNIRITNNTVTNSDDDGIEVVDGAAYLYIVGNDIDNSGTGFDAAPDYFGGDGIHVRNVAALPFGYTQESDGDIGNGEYNIVIANNEVSDSDDDGIEVVGSDFFMGTLARTALVELPYYFGGTGRVLVQNNDVSNSGYGVEDEVEGDDEVIFLGLNNDGYGADGIHARNIYPEGEYAVGESEEGLYSGYAVDILGNDVNNSGDDGIEVSSSSSTLIDDNTVTNSGFMSGEGEVNTLVESGDGYGADGIFVNNVGEEYYDFDDEFEGPFGIDAKALEVAGDGYTEYSVVIRRNNVDNSADDGIQVNNSLWDDSTAPVLVDINENVSDSGSHGLYISGPSHSDVIVSGNNFAGFDIGAEFESGLIDLTGDGNTFTDGRVGLRFSPIGEVMASLVPGFSYLELVDVDGDPDSLFVPGVAPTNYYGTIGAQTFDDISQYYVELGEGAFTHGETYPLWINGLNSSYDGFVPGDNIDGDGFISQADFDFMNGKIYDFRDEGFRDIFFFGLRAPDDLALIDQSDIFNRFAAFNGDITGLNVRITGLPNIPGGGTAANFNNINTFAGGNGGSNPAALNEIQTAAGNTEPGTTAADLNTVTPEAGGSDEACWSSAMNAAGNGQVVNVVYSGTISDNLTQAAACGGTF